MQKAGWMFLPFAGLFVPASRVRKSTIAVGQAWARRGSTKSWPPTGLPYGEQPFATLHDSLHRGGLLERPPARPMSASTNLTSENDDPQRLGRTLEPHSADSYDFEQGKNIRTGADQRSVLPSPPRADRSPSNTLPLRLLRPTSRNTLYQKLLFMLSRAKFAPPLPALIDYHSLYPTLRSTRSYNLLIGLSIWHAAFGTVEWLFDAMRADKIPENLETQKLRIRWLIRSGQWDRAWMHVLGRRTFTGYASLDVREDVNGVPTAIPLSLWLEFFNTLKRGAIRRPGMPRLSMGQDGNLVHNKIVKDSEYAVTQSPHHYLELMKYIPTFEVTRSSARTVYFAVLSMLRTRQRQIALTLATQYLANLPPNVDDKWARKCLAIIHLFIVFSSAKKGLHKMYDARRTLMTLLALHPCLRASSTTLYLLLGTLRGSSRSGGVAWNILQRFKGRWGAQIASQRVRRRVASFAVRERRWDIVHQILGRSAFSRETYTKRRLRVEIMAHRRLARRSWRITFQGKGKSRRLWSMLELRAHREKLKEM